ncbi:hypothetical protein [Lentzea flava]|uniref:hypothetical protein n=1 Tax=Lentzea flava TaxID=103732 RepID=UPI00166F8B6F|nr:hypothetical protein [Lentzea flava]MCP2204622.1 hypothetical protein [Lentzea flava]
MRPAAWLGDLVRAVAAVTPPGEPPDPDVVGTVARMLGITEPVPVEKITSREVPTAQQDEPVTPVLPPASSDVPFGEHPERPEPPRFDDAEDDTGRGPLVGLRESWVEVAKPTLVWEDENVAMLERTTVEQLRRKPPFEPLLRRASTAAMVQSLMTQRLPGDEVDVDALIDEVAAGRAVTSLPRLPQPTLRCGAHVLIEDSEAMSLFWRDQWELARVVRNVVGAALTDVSVFSSTPLWPRRGHSHPAPRRAVLVLSAFDVLQGRAEREEWEYYVAWLRQRECRVAGLVPFPPDRWSRWLTRLMPLVCWDRGTTVGTVRSALERVA